jgi:hypothetical protein
MASLQITKVSLSTEEMALVYSLLNLPASGKSLLFELYGEMAPSKIEEKLITASHSLMARGLVTLSAKGTVVLHEGMEKIFLPLIQFANKVQIIMNDQGKDKDVVISATDYYLGENGFFTSHEIDMGVIHHLFHGEISALAELMMKRMKFTDQVSKFIGSGLAKKKSTLKMADYPQLEQMGKHEAAKKLTSLGIDPLISQALSEDICNPVRRGSVILADVSSKTLENKDFSKTGAGFFWLVGEKSSWIMAFDRGDQETSAVISPGTTQEAKKLLQEMLT